MKESNPLFDAAHALMLLVEGPGCLRWEDGNGSRLKDTSQWAAFYCAVKAAPPAVPVESRYECRECDNCGHAGINDASTTEGACFSCEWSGPEPVEDKCPGCGDEGCMTAACPKCGARYRLVAELESATSPDEPVASVPDGWLLGWARPAEIEKTQRHRSKREGSAIAVFVHAEKNETYSVPVYAPPTNQEGAAP